MKELEKTDGYSRPPVIVNNLKSCKRLYTRILTEIQLGTIQNDKAKLLIYGLSNFVSMSKDLDFDLRLSELESKILKGN